MGLADLINKLNLKEALDHVASPWALGYFPSATALRMGLQRAGIEDTVNTVEHFFAGGMIATLCYDLVRGGRKGAAVVLAGLVTFNVLWENTEAAIGASAGLQTFDTYADVFAVCAGGMAALGMEYFRHRHQS